MAAAVANVKSSAAQEPVKVGQAEIVRNEVMSVSEAELIPISVGDDVMRDEVVRTSADSDTKIVLADDTKLSIGPGSTLKIDRAVYSGETRYREIALNLTSGTFRFITGKSDKKSYKIETPMATIGVRGTILDIRIQDNQTLVALQDGQASVCAGSKCTQLLQPGHTANVARAGGVTRITRDLVPTWTFASICSGNNALCSPLPANPLRKASLPSKPEINSAKNLAKPVTNTAITRYCSDGSPSVNGVCGANNAQAIVDRFLPDLSNTARRTAIDTPQISQPTFNAPSRTFDAPSPAFSSPRIQGPSLRR